MPKLRIFCLMLLGLCSLAGDVPQAPAQVPEAGAARLAALRARGTAASLTVLPVRLAGRPFDRLTEVIGLLLEQRGMTALELGTRPVEPGAPGDLQQLAASVGAAVRKEPIATDCALYAEYNGSPQTGLTEVRAVLVDRTGEPLWSRRLSSEDPALREAGARNPMGYSMALAEALEPLFGLSEQTTKAAKPGPMARRMEERSGLPPEAERAAIPARLARMKAAGPERTLAVYPARMGGSLDPAGTEGLFRAVLAAGLKKLVPGSADLLLTSPQRDPNEQKVLWDLARAFREHLRKNPPGADYALYADCVFNPDNWEQGYVHVVVCDRAGEWVLVDFQNSHHPDYREAKPASADACRTLAAKRLRGALD